MAPTLVAEELAQHLTQKLHIEIGRLLNVVSLGQPAGELVVQLLAAGEPGFLQMGRGLEPRIPLQRRAELLNDPAAESKAGGS